MDSLIGFAILGIFPLCMIFATFYDLFTMTIPNKITLALLAGFVVLAPLAGMGLETALWSVGVSLLVLICGFTLFSFGIMGGGDAKLLAASALWFGPTFTGSYIVLVGMLGGLLTIAILMSRRYPLPVRLAVIPWISRLHTPKSFVPYGVALGPAALYVFAESHWMNFVTSGAPLG